MPDDGVAARIEDALAAVVPADVVAPVPRPADQVEDLADALPFARRVVGRGRDYLLSPQMTYEQVGDVPNVVFPCAALVDAEADRVTIYYGAADTTTCVAHGHLSEIIAFARG